MSRAGSEDSSAALALKPSHQVTWKKGIKDPVEESRSWGSRNGRDCISDLRTGNPELERGDGDTSVSQRSKASLCGSLNGQRTILRQEVLQQLTN